MSSRVLVADDDVDVAGLVRMSLELEGFAVEVVPDGRRALERICADPPDVVLLDVMMPGLDGVEVVRRLRASAATAALPVLLLTARGLSADKVVGLTAGADDYIVKPFDTAELVARIRTTLRRTADVRAVSPLTGLPGNGRIELELRSRLGSGQAFAVSHVDLDEFKSYNDRYGFLRGDGLLRALGACLLDAATDEDPPVFVGHVGGDDFVVLSTPEQAERVARRTVERFDEVVRAHYDAEDLERGHLRISDRRGELREHPIVSVSIGVAWHRDGDADARAVVAAAGEMKAYAKSRPGSVVAVDRRG
jgi:diguanylate cyclase (GGDEF)-like protein